jgi:hypothetical protein
MTELDLMGATSSFNNLVEEHERNEQHKCLDRGEIILDYENSEEQGMVCGGTLDLLQKTKGLSSSFGQLRGSFEHN